MVCVIIAIFNSCRLLFPIRWLHLRSVHTYKNIREKHSKTVRSNKLHTHTGAEHSLHNTRSLCTKLLKETQPYVLRL